MTSPLQTYNFKVHIQNQAHEEPPSVAQFFRDIFSVSLNDYVDIIFIPSFSREKENWSLKIANDVEDVRSLDDARQFTAALSPYTVTPDKTRANQQELIRLAPSLLPNSESYLPSSHPREEGTGVIFYLSQKDFTRLSQELAMLSQYTQAAYDCLPFSEVKDFESIQFILAEVIRSPHFAEHDLEIVNLPWHHHLFNEVRFTKIEPLIYEEEEQASYDEDYDFTLSQTRTTAVAA